MTSGRGIVARAAAVGLMSAAVVTLGCGSGGATKVTGTVTAGGKKVVWGEVSLISSVDNKSYGGFINPDGTYAIEDVPAGPVQIGVYSPEPTAPKREVDERPGVKQEAPPERPLPPKGAWFKLDEKYADPLRSGLKGEVKRGEPLDIKLP